MQVGISCVVGNMMISFLDKKARTSYKETEVMMTSQEATVNALDMTQEIKSLETRERTSHWVTMAKFLGSVCPRMGFTHGSMVLFG